MARGDVTFPPGLPLSTQVVQRAKYWEAYVISTSLDMPQALWLNTSRRFRDEGDALAWVDETVEAWKLKRKVFA